jgi:hypothetical protein
MKCGDIKHLHVIRKTEDAAGLIARLGSASGAF